MVFLSNQIATLWSETIHVFLMFESVPRTNLLSYRNQSMHSKFIFWLYVHKRYQMVFLEFDIEGQKTYQRHLIIDWGSDVDLTDFQLISFWILLDSNVFHFISFCIVSLSKSSVHLSVQIRILLFALECTTNIFLAWTTRFRLKFSMFPTSPYVAVVTGYHVFEPSYGSWNKEWFKIYLPQKKSKGQVLLDQVFKNLDLVEKDYFGLQFMDTHQVSVSLCIFLAMVFYVMKIWFVLYEKGSS